jgi:hypothetical protein
MREIAHDNARLFAKCHRTGDDLVVAAIVLVILAWRYGF